MSLFAVGLSKFKDQGSCYFDFREKYPNDPSHIPVSSNNQQTEPNKCLKHGGESKSMRYIICAYRIRPYYHTVR